MMNCACEEKDGRVISFCGAHEQAYRDRNGPLLEAYELMRPVVTAARKVWNSSIPGKKRFKVDVDAMMGLREAGFAFDDSRET